LEAFYRDQPTPADRTIDNAMTHFREIFPEYMNDEAVAELEFDELNVQRYAAEITKLIRTYFTMEDPTTIDLVSTEQRLDYDMGGWGVRGIIDRFDRLSDGTLAIRDYKTGKVPKGKYADKALQPSQVYAFLAEKVLGERPSVMTLLYVKTGEIIERPVTETDIRNAEQRVRAVWDAVERCYEKSYFPAQPTILCNWCSFRDRCNEDNYSVF
jgi:putative RecB family exonuclease